MALPAENRVTGVQSPDGPAHRFRRRRPAGRTGLKSAMPSAPAPAAHILGIHPAVGSVGLRANFVLRWHRNGRAVTYMTLCTEIVATRVHGPGGPTPIDCRLPAHPRGQVRKVRCRGHCRWHPRIAGCSRRGNRRPTAELCTLVTTNRHPSDTNDNVGRICCQQWPKFAARDGMKAAPGSGQRICRRGRLRRQAPLEPFLIPGSPTRHTGGSSERGLCPRVTTDEPASDMHDSADRKQCHPCPKSAPGGTPLAAAETTPAVRASE